MLTLEPPVIDEYGLVRRHGRWVAVSPQLERALRLLLDGAGEVVSRERLRAALWPNGDGTGRNLDTLIYRLRDKLRPLGLTIHTIRRKGFMLEISDRHDQGAPWPTS